MIARFLVTGALLLIAAGLFSPAQAENYFHFKLVPEKLELTRDAAARLELEIRTDAGYYLYKDMLVIKATGPAGVEVGAATYPPPHVKFDPASDMEREIYEGTNRFPISLTAGGSSPERGQITVTVDYQGCSKLICYLPATITLKAEIVIAAGRAPTQAQTPPATPPAPPREPVSSTAAVPPASPAIQESDLPKPASAPISPAPVTAAPSEADAIRDMIGRSHLLAFLFIFVYGIGLSFTPCVYPVIPITVSVFGARGAETRLKGFLLSLVYVQGIAVIYSVLGVAAALSGAVFGQHMSNPWIVGGIVALFFVLGLFMAGVFQFNLPSSVQTKAAQVGGKGFVGAFTMGLVSGVIAAPCTGPALAGVLAYVATTRNALLGFLLLYTYSIGFGLIFMVLGTFSTLIRKIPKSGAWMEIVKGIFGAAMFTVGLYFLKDIVPSLRLDFLSRDALLLAGPLLVVIGFLSRGLRHDLHGASWRQILHKSFAIAALTVGAFAFVMGAIRPAEPPRAAGVGAEAGVAWQHDLDAALASARESGKPVMVDFYADWCAACKELDLYTWSDPKVQTELRRFVVVKVDMTRSSPRDAFYKSTYGIVGLPVVAFHDSQGRLLAAPRVTGFVAAEPFLKLVQDVR